MKIFPMMLALVVIGGTAIAAAPNPELPKSTPAPTPPAGAKKGAASAKNPLQYVPPKGTMASVRIDGDGGSRGGSSLPSLYVLAPNHTGLTTQAQPVLFWYQSGPATTRFELTITESQKPKPLLRVGTDKPNEPGIHRYLLSKSKLSLTPGVVYRWTVALIPDPANRSKDMIASGTIQSVEPSAPLKAALAAPGPGHAETYSRNGFWYDALEAITNEIDAAPKNKELHRLRATLLDQAGLKEAAVYERKGAS